MTMDIGKARVKRSTNMSLKSNSPILLNRIDYTGRIAVKIEPL